jgi:hypothetical protein
MKTGTRTPRSPKSRPLIGWREWVAVPDLSPVPIKAKIDTGARTSTLHAFDLSIELHNGESWADFEVHPTQRSRADRTAVSCPIQTFKRVRSSTGHAERRPVIRTTIQIGDYHYDIELTLTSRDEMGFRMLLGRSALRRRFWVDPGLSFLHAKPAIGSERKSP